MSFKNNTIAIKQIQNISGEIYRKRTIHYIIQEYLYVQLEAVRLLQSVSMTIEIYFTVPVSNPDGFSIASLYRTNYYKYISVIQLSSEKHSFKRILVHGGVTEEYLMPLRYCSQAITKNRVAECEKSSQEISQVPLHYRNYPWTGDQLSAPGETGHRRYRADGQFGMNKHCWSAIFYSGFIRFAEKGYTKTERSTKEKELRHDH